jgi:hypothetical protein
VSHGDFVKQADAICSAFAAHAQPLPRPRRYEQVAAYVAKNLPLYEAALRKLEALQAPPQDRPAVARWLGADRRIAAALHDLGDAALRHDYPALTAAALRVESAGFASREAAGTLGLHTCGGLSAR